MNLLKVDLDSKKDLTRLVKETDQRLSSIENLAGVTIYSRKIKRTRHGFHIYVEYLGEQLPPKDEIIMQLCLQDDYRRALYSYRRVKNKTPRFWNILFESKYKKGRLVSKEI